MSETKLTDGKDPKGFEHLSVTLQRFCCSTNSLLDGFFSDLPTSIPTSSTTWDTVTWKNTHCFLSCVHPVGFDFLYIYLKKTKKKNPGLLKADHFYTHPAAATKKGTHALSSQSFVKQQARKVRWKFHRGRSYNCPVKLHTRTGGCFVIPCSSVLLRALTLTESLPGGLKAAPRGQGMGRSLRCNCHCRSSSLGWLGVIRGRRKLSLNSTCSLEFRVKVPLKSSVAHISE